MAQNLDLVRAIFADWAEGEFWARGWYRDEIEWVRPDGPEPGSWSGIGALGDGWREWLSVWEEFRIEAEGFRELDSERVLVTYKGRGKSSGVDVGQTTAKGAGLFHIRDDKVDSLVTYWDRDRAFADLGLSE